MPGFEIIGKDEQKAINQLFEDGGILFAHGFDAMRKNFHVREFEQMANESFGCKHSLAVSSGTAAIKIALKALGIGPNDEVITQAFNFIATIEAIVDVGAKPIIANVDDSLNMDIADAESLITKNTKLLLPVHMLGVPVDMEGVLMLAEKYQLKILEDNCESIGAKYKGKYLGTIGDAGALSFDFGKIITTGEGGMVLTNRSIVDKYAREYHDHGHENNPQFARGKDTKSIYGFNYRMTEMQAVVGKVQLSKLEEILTQNKIRYKALEKNISSNINKRTIPKGSEPIYDAFIFFVEDEKIKNQIINLLNKEGFGTKNLPDAVEWHCVFYWDHILDKNQIKHAIITNELLNEAIAVPIWLRKSVDEYFSLGHQLKNIL